MITLTITFGSSSPGSLQPILDAINLLRKDFTNMDARLSTLISNFNTETNNISTRIDRLITMAGSGSLDATELVAALTPISERLRALGSDQANPIPTDDNPPVPATS